MAPESRVGPLYRALGAVLAAPGEALTPLLGHPLRLAALEVAGPPGIWPRGAPVPGDLDLALQGPGGETAWLRVASDLGRGLLALAGDPRPVPPGLPVALTATESGVIAALVATALASEPLAAGIRITAAVPAGTDDQPGSALAVAARYAVGPAQGWLQARLDPEAAQRLTEALLRAHPVAALPPGGVPVTGRLRLARATVRGDRLLGLAVGDVLQLPGVAPVRGEALSGHLCLGPIACRATLVASGAGDRLTIESEVSIMEEPERPEGIEALASGDLLERLPVVLTVELGRVELTAADVASLLPGAVIALDRPLGSLVDVLAGSRRIARGELVEVQGALAVRLTEVTL